MVKIDLFLVLKVIIIILNRLFSELCIMSCHMHKHVTITYIHRLDDAWIRGVYGI